MMTYIVTMADGTERVVKAERYIVEVGGPLEFYDDQDNVILTMAAGTWKEVKEK